MSAPILAFAMCFAGVFCLTPLSAYLMWLAGLNRRMTPTVLSGLSDFLALIAGLSGFLIFGSLLAITALQSNARYWARGNFEQLRTAWQQEKWIWLGVAVGYVALVLFAVIVGAWRRNRVLSVYAVDLDSVIATLDSEMERFSPATKRTGYSWGNLLRIEPFNGMGHVVVRITTTDRSQADELDRLLRNALPHALPAAHTSAGWFHSAAVCSGIGALGSLVLVFLYMWFFR
ncbi:MAG: hypothetical protein U0798_20170 [Gemmataceae bacterium]